MHMWSWIWQHRLWTIPAVAIITVLVAGAVVWFFVLRSSATPLNLRQALRLYREEMRGRSARNEADLPAAGVYEYATTGGEQLSFMNIRRSFPSPSPMIVTGGSCATERWEPLQQHVESIVECVPGTGSVNIRSAVTFEQIAGISTTTTISCPSDAYLVPANAMAGDTWTSMCHSANQQVRLAGRVIGQATVKVGDDQVPAWHTHVTLSFSGNEVGTNPVDYWVSKRDGLLLRERETVNLSQPAGPLGSVRYGEQMDISLLSLTPDR